MSVFVIGFLLGLAFPALVRAVRRALTGARGRLP